MQKIFNMKLVVLIIVSLVLVSLIGCSKNNTKSEEELRAEIKAELQAEASIKDEAIKENESNVEPVAETVIEQKQVEEEKVIGPQNMAIKNYKGDGLERLSKTSVKYGSGKVVETLAIFGEVTNVKVGLIELATETNYALIKEYASLKDTELTISRSSEEYKLIQVTFYDKGLREHTYAFTSGENYNEIYKGEDKQELIASFDEKDKKSTTYQDKSDLIVNSLGLSEKEFQESGIFKNIQSEYNDFEDETYYRVVNEPLGYDFDFNKRGTDIFNVTIMLNENYKTLKGNDKCSFFGVDFDMPIYQARYNLKISDGISIELNENPEREGELGSITISK